MEVYTARDRANAEIERRAREQKRLLWPVYDWYGDECGCEGSTPNNREIHGLDLGECRVHPRARPDQRPPGSYRASSSRDDWGVWLLDMGRGAGKTHAAARFITHEVFAGRARWVALINDTVGDVRDLQINHIYSGLVKICPPWFKCEYQPSYARVVWSDGGKEVGIGNIYSAENPEKLRGPEFHIAWADELAKWQKNQGDTWDNLQFCLRAITKPRTRVVVTSTPKPTPTFKAILHDSDTAVTRARMLDNAVHLDDTYKKRMLTKYGNTRLGRQELDAELLEDTPGALWTHAMTSAAYLEKVPADVSLVTVVVSIDPSAGSNNPDTAAETGITVSAKGSDGHMYVLEDRSLKGPPDQWGTAAVRAYIDWEANVVIGEVNNGGDMVGHVVQNAAQSLLGHSVPFKAVRATRGKEVRAEPISSLYEQGKVHHVGKFEKLEKQLVEWVPGEKSPDRLDSLVWGGTYLMCAPTSDGEYLHGASRSSYASGMLAEAIGLDTGHYMGGF